MIETAPTFASRAELAARIGDDLEARADAFERAARRVAHGGDDKAIHDLRVATRRLGESLRVWRAFLLPKAARQARAGLGRLRRRLGSARDSEILHATFTALVPDVDPEAGPILELLIEAFDRRLRRARGRARRAARPRRVARILEFVSGARASLPERIGGLADPLREPRARTERRRERADAALARTVGSDDDGVLHEARIAVKKDRYAEECLAAIAPSPDPGRPGRLRALQQTLGRVHDRSVASAWLERLERTAAARGRLASAEALAGLRAAIENERREALARFSQTLGAGPRAVPAPLALADREAPPTEPFADETPRSPGERLPAQPPE